MLSSRPDCPDLGQVRADRLLRSLRRAWARRGELDTQIDRMLVQVCDDLGVSHRATSAATKIPKSTIGRRVLHHRADAEEAAA